MYTQTEAWAFRARGLKKSIEVLHLTLLDSLSPDEKLHRNLGRLQVLSSGPRVR